MPHQCVRCGALYEDGDNALLDGCECGAKLFFFIKKDKLKKVQQATEKLSKKEKQQIEKDVFDLVGSEVDKGDPVVLDLESIRIMKPGKYELDLVHLFKKDPVVFKVGDGKYMIDLIASFAGLKKK